jgi:cytochrome c553
MTSKLTALAFCVAAALFPASTRAMSTTQEERAAVHRAVPNIDRGAQLFQVCAACHQADGRGTSDGLVPRIAGQHASVLAKQLVDYRHDKRWDMRMEHFSEKHFLADAQAIADVTADVAQMPEPAPAATGPGESEQRGAEIYSRRCRSCHGGSGEGDRKQAVPRIAGQQYEYLRRQIYDAVDGRRPNFPDEHIRLLARLDHDDIVNVADFLSRANGNKDVHVMRAGTERP